MYSTFSKAKTCFIVFLCAINLIIANTSNPIKTKEKISTVFSSQYENVLGTSFEIKVKTTSNKQALLAEKIALNEINRLSGILSAYDKSSEFSILMRTQNVPVKVSKELIEVLSLFDTWNANTHGALNPAAELVNQVWKKAEKTQIIPTTDELKSVIASANQQHWSIDTYTGTVTHLTKTPLLLNTFVKSYIIDQATKKAMKIPGIEGIVMNIGGDILVSGGQNETVEIANPKSDAINDEAIDLVKIQNKFIATSGNYKRGYTIGNQWYSHIIDPRTALPADAIMSATVIANNATDAGALATAFNVLSVSESKDLAQQFPDVAYLIITNEGERIESDNWSSIKNNEELINNEIATANDQWNPKFELIVSLELAQIQGPSRRPFVAIWVENKDKDPVRTLTVWYNKPRWLRDLRAWYRANYAKFNPESQTINSVSSATRSSGKYAIKWDGKNDNGEYVKQGDYTIHIEVAREHGTYQLISQIIKINNKATKIELKANPEVASASLEVKKK